MTDIRQLLINPRKRVKLASAKVEVVQRPDSAETSGLAASTDDDDDLPQDVIERDDDDNGIAQTVS